MINSKREWSNNLSDEVVFLIDVLERQGKLGVIVDLGAGEGRHSIYAANKGAEKVIAIEKDPQQTSIIKTRKEKDNLTCLRVIEGDVLKKLATFDDGMVDGMIDCGMSHCLKEEIQRKKLASLIQAKLNPGGLYSITHFSGNETLSTGHFKTNLEGLKKLFPDSDWEAVMPWQERSWEREDGQKHFAYKAVLKKKK